MISQEGKQILPRMLISIMQTKDEKKLEEVLQSLHIPVFYQCRGQGTAPSEMLDILGFSGTARLITICFLPRFCVKDILDEMDKRLSFGRKGHGIALTVPVIGLQSPLLSLLQDKAKQEIEKKVEGEEKQMKGTAAHTAIWVSVASGYSDEVVDAARKVGARGGTVIKGRRHSSQKMSEYLGVPLHEEQDFVLIIVPKEKKTEVMSAINSACGLKTQAHGLILALPVDEAVGLE